MKAGEIVTRIKANLGAPRDALRRGALADAAYDLLGGHAGLQ